MFGPNKPNSKIHPLDLKTEAKRACEKTFEDATSAYPLLSADRVPYVCLDLTYQYALLTDGFGRFLQSSFVLKMLPPLFSVLDFRFSNYFSLHGVFSKYLLIL